MIYPHYQYVFFVIHTAVFHIWYCIYVFITDSHLEGRLAIYDLVFFAFVMHYL
jgi:hypothetical protein